MGKKGGKEGGGGLSCYEMNHDQKQYEIQRASDREIWERLNGWRRKRSQNIHCSEGGLD